MLIYAFPNLTMPQIAALTAAFDDRVGAAGKWLERCRPCRKRTGLYFTKGHYKELHSGRVDVDPTKPPRQFRGNNKKVVIKSNSKVSFWGGNFTCFPGGFLYDLFDVVMVDGVEVGIRNFVNHRVVFHPDRLTPISLVAKRKNKQVSGSCIVEVKGPKAFNEVFDLLTNLDNWKPRYPFIVEV